MEEIYTYLVKYSGDGSASLRLFTTEGAICEQAIEGNGASEKQTTTNVNVVDDDQDQHESSGLHGLADSFHALKLEPSDDRDSGIGSDSEDSLLQSPDHEGFFDVFNALTSSSNLNDDDDFADVFGALSLSSPEPKRKSTKYRGKHTPKRALMRVLFIGPTEYDYLVQLQSLQGTRRPSIEFPVLKRSPKKTVAVLRGSRNDNLIASVSGWSDEFGSSHAYVLRNSVWAAKAITLCQTIGHTLLEDWRDGGIPGRFNACHAEKQLLAHVFEHRRRKVRLYVSCEPCGDCAVFIGTFAAFTGVRVDVFVHGHMVLRA